MPSPETAEQGSIAQFVYGVRVNQLFAFAVIVASAFCAISAILYTGSTFELPLSTAMVQHGSGQTHLASVPYPEVLGQTTERGTASFKVAGAIQGYRVAPTGQALPDATITVGTSTYGPSVNPYYATITSGVQTVSSTQPEGYDVYYSACSNCADHPDNSYVKAATATVTVPGYGYVDVWWKYVTTAPATPPSPTPPPAPTPTPPPAPVPPPTQAPIPVQGYKVDANGTPFSNPGATITVSGQTYGPTVNPYFGSANTVTTTVTTSVPTGYSAFYSICVNCIDHPASSYVAGSSASVTLPSSGVVDLWWKYVPVSSGDHAPIGHIDSAQCDALTGWAFDPDTSNSIGVHVYEGSTFLAATTATLSRPDVNAAYSITGNHGFYILVPNNLKNGQAHTLTLYGINDTSPVNINPVIDTATITCAPPAPSAFSPSGTTLPTTTTQTVVTWPQVVGAVSYQLFVNDMADPSARMAGSTCAQSTQYYCSTSGPALTQQIQVMAGHVYQWWVKALNASGQVVQELDVQAFAVARPQNQLDIRVSRSLVQPGESYYLYALKPSGVADMVPYVGPLEVQVTVCPAATPTQCAAPVVAAWYSTDANGKYKANLPTTQALGIYYAKFRPNSNWQWSNLAQVNVGTTYGLTEVPQYWNLQTANNYSGKNTANNTPFQNQIGYTPETICPGQQVTTMYFTKDKPQGYWNPEYPGSGWTSTDNLKWHLVPWHKEAAWQDEFLTSPGYHAYQYNSSGAPNSLQLGNNFTQQTHVVKYGTQDPEFPGYILAARWVGPGWGIRDTIQSYAVAIGSDVSYCNLQINFSNPSFSTPWTVLADMTTIHTPTYDGPVLHFKYGEGSLKEDWYFKQGTGLIKIQQKTFDFIDGPCVNDYDCKQNLFPTKAPVTTVQTSTVSGTPVVSVVKDGYVDTASSTAISGWSYDSSAGNTGQSVTVVIEKTDSPQTTFTKVVPASVVSSQAEASAEAYLHQIYGNNLVVAHPLGFTVNPTTFVTTPGTYKVRSVTTIGGYAASLSPAVQNTTFSVGVIPTEVTYNGNDAVVHFAGSDWINYPLATAYSNDEIATGHTGDTATLTVSSATRLKIYGAKAYNRGKIKISIDGVDKGTFDIYDPSVQIGKMLYDSGDLALGTHTFKIENASTGQTNPYIGLDKIVVTQAQ